MPSGKCFLPIAGNGAVDELRVIPCRPNACDERDCIPVLSVVQAFWLAMSSSRAGSRRAKLRQPLPPEHLRTTDQIFRRNTRGFPPYVRFDIHAASAESR